MKSSLNPMEETKPEETPRAQLDLELVARARAGDPAAFEELARRYGPKVYRTARYLCHGHEQDAQDSAQNALLKAYLHLGTFRGEAPIAAWMARIAFNECLMMQRQRRGQPRLAPLDELRETDEGKIAVEVPDSRLNPEQESSRAELRQILVRAAQSLKEPYRSVLRLRDVQGLSTAETSRELGLSQGAVKSALLRARKKLQPYLRDHLCRESVCDWPGLMGSESSSSTPNADQPAAARGRNTPVRCGVFGPEGE